ncbi:MAG: FecR domain-containing protein [Pseudomonadota bacterium]
MTDSPKNSEDLYAEAHEWRILLDSPDVTNADRCRFENWIDASPLHAEYFDKAVTMWAALGHLSRNDIDQDLLEGASLVGSPHLNTSVSNGVFQWLSRSVSSGIDSARPLAGVSLTLIIGLVVTISIISIQLSRPPGSISARVFETGIGEVKTFDLEDGSTISLGAASAAEVVYSDGARRVALSKGVALFDVASDANRPFSVATERLTATVLGTSFEVNTVGDVLRVAVVEGDVAVSYPMIIDGTLSSFLTQRKLTVGEMVSANPTTGLSEKNEVDPNRIGAWQKDRLIYSGAPLSELVADANRYSDKPVFIDDASTGVAHFLVRGAFNAQDIDSMLSSLEAIHPVTVDRSFPDKVVIRSSED